jgi:hypothetical protein
MTSSRSKKIKHRKAFAAVKPSRAPIALDPDLNTPPLTAASASVSETESPPQFSPHISPSLQPTYTHSPSMAFQPMMPSDNPMDFNPFLLPSVAYPAFGPNMRHHPMNPHAFGPGPMMFDQKMTAMKKKKADSRVVFSDEASIISDDRGSATTRSTTEDDASESDHTETERRTRTTRKPTTVEKPKRREPTKVPDQKRASTRSVTSTTNSKAMQVRRRTLADRSRTASRVTSSRVAEDDEFESEPDDLMGRISSAIPDLHLLLTKYKETNGELGVRDQLRRRLEAQQAEMVKSKEETIQSLMQQLEDAAKEHADETSQLRSKISALERNQVQFTEDMASAEERAKSAESRMKSFEEGEKRVTRQNEQYIIERTTFAKRAAEETERALIRQRDKLLEEFGKERDALRTELERERRDMAIRIPRQHQELEAKFQNQKEELEANFQNQKEEFESKIQKEKEEFEAQLQKGKEEFESQFKKEKEDLETKVADLDKQLEELGKTDSEVREKLDKEYSEKEANLSKKHEEEMEALKEHHKNATNEQMRGFISIQERLNKHLMEENATLKSLMAGHTLDPSPPSASVEAVEDEG